MGSPISCMSMPFRRDLILSIFRFERGFTFPESEMPPNPQSSGSDCTSRNSSLRLRLWAGDLENFFLDMTGEVTGDVRGLSVCNRCTMLLNMVLTLTWILQQRCYPQEEHIEQIMED
uniref:Uncharacterized protein n=1 Tax=Cacopsylla melanoneura TaxID=428564 RepID=A0A8D9B8C1_9HEMI